MSAVVNSTAARARGATPAMPVAPVAALAPPTPADKAPLPGSTPPRFAALLRQSRAEAAPPSSPWPAATQTPTTPSPPTADQANRPGTRPSPPSSGATGSGNAATSRASAAKDDAAAAQSSDGQGSGDERVGSEHDDKDGLGDSHRETASATTPTGERGDAAAATALAAQDGSRAAAATSSDSDRERHGDTRSDARGGGAIGDGAIGDGASAASAAAATSGREGQGRALAAIDSAAERRASLLEAGRDKALGAETAPAFQAALKEQTGRLSSAEFTESRPHEGALDGIAAALAGAAAPATTQALPAAAAPAALAMTTPLDSPDFAARLGVHVSVLAKDGVQRAELHLNPAEMGPVSIHIALDGHAARVDFGADVAATRQAIERGLPELASALQDAGFTLAGGGVSQHAGGRAGSDEAGAARTLRRVDGEAAPRPGAGAAALRSVHRIAAGGVDLYA